VRHPSSQLSRGSASATTRWTVAALTKRHISLALVGDVNSAAVAEHVLALMLGLARRLALHDRATREGRFQIRDAFSTTELAEKTALIVGYSRIGRQVSRRCAAFDMRVIVADPVVAAAAEADGHRHVGDFRTAWGEADVVTVHVPRGPDTEHLIGRREIAAMRPGTILINAARGGIVDESALYDALASGRLGGAGLDVFAKEPPEPSHPLFRLDNVLVSPHSAAFTDECGRRMAVASAKNVLDCFEGRLDPSLVVNKEVLGRGRPPR
jgi:D-3-phosphoglycerate dehydrogenase / 2-oxoglutarate reductase